MENFDARNQRNKWRDIACSWIGRRTISKMSVLLNLIYRFNEISVETSQSYFVVIGKLVPKLIWRYKESQMLNIRLNEKNKVGGLTLLDFKTYSRATVIEAVYYG